MFLNIVNWLVYNVLDLEEGTKFADTLDFFIYDVIKILFLLFFIITLISYLRFYINNSKFKSYIEKQPKIISHFLASCFGAITPFCSCSSIPIFIGFIESGLPFGVAMSFLITSPMINEIAIIILAGIVGLKITLIYLFTGIFVGTFGGYLMEKLGFEKYLQEYLFKIGNNRGNISCKCSCSSDLITKDIKERLKKSIENAIELFKKIFLFVILGVGVGAFIHGYIPEEFFMKYMQSDNLFAVPLAVFCGIPLYSDATTIIPIAQVLIQKGCAIGTVLVFMMSVVGLSLPEMIILSKVMKKELIIRYILFMAITFITIGYLYNFVAKFY